MTGINLAVEFINNGYEDMTDAGKTVFAKTCIDLGIKVNEPITKAEFDRLSGIIATMAGDNAMEEVASSKEFIFGEKARRFAEASKEKLEEGVKFATENIDTVKEEVKQMANMPPELLEDHLKSSGKKHLRKIMKGIEEFISEKRKSANELSYFAKTDSQDAERAENLLVLIKDIMDDENKSGWGKFVSIVKELAKWVVKVFLTIGAVVLKIAFTGAVGVIKIGAATLVSAGAVGNALYKEVFKPAFKAGKKVWNKAKEKAANIKDALQDDDFDEDEFFEDEELYNVVDEQ